MAFTLGCSCHVWAIDGYVNDNLAAAVNTRYANESNRLLLAGAPLGNRNARIQHLVQYARIGHEMTYFRATFFGGWQNNTDAAPEHMWLVYNGYIYDTMPGAPLRRKAAGFMGWHHLHPPSEQAAFARNMVGRWQGLLTRSQVHIIHTAVWDGNNEYTPPELGIAGW